MTSKPDKSQRRDVIDPAVAAMLDELQDKSDERSQSRAERQRKARARAKAKARNRVMLDLPPEIEARLKALADDERTPVSQIAALLIWQGLNDLDSGRLDLDRFKKPSRSPRYNWNLIFPPESENDEF